MAFARRVRGVGLARARWSRIRLLATASAIVVLATGCAPSTEAPTPGELSFDPQITFGDALAEGLAGVGAEGDSVLVGHVIGDSVTARESPSSTAPIVAELANPTDVGGPLVFQLLRSEVLSLADDAWVEVHLPVRPNGTTGWVPAAELEFSRNPYRIEIDTSDHRLEVWRSGQRWLETTVGIGTGNTPTPIGQFYIIELLQPPDPTGLYGPFAFGLSGFSETLLSFAGGDGVIGIHGTDEPEALGTDVSHGCVRVHNDVIAELAGIIPLGTPVVITA